MGTSPASVFDEVVGFGVNGDHAIRAAPPVERIPLLGKSHAIMNPAISCIPVFGIAETPAGCHLPPSVNAKKKTVVNRSTSAPAKARGLQAICLRPSKSDYETFAKTTALAMGRTVRDASTPKPNQRLLWLLNLGA